MTAPNPYRLAATLLLLAAVACLTACRQGAPRPYAELLDRTLADKARYDGEKERRIDGLRLLLGVDGLTAEQEYGINERLYAEYKKYQIDSAIRYTERNAALAAALGDTDRTIASRLRLARLYSSSGRSVEALEILRSVDGRALPRALRFAYYQAYSQFYQHYAVLSRQTEYRRTMNAYIDSMLLVGDPSSLRYKLSQLSRAEERAIPDSLIGYLERLYAEVEPTDDPQLAEVAFYLGYFHQFRGEAQQSRDYYMLSAIIDVRHSIKENASFRLLAMEYYNEGDYSRAFRYTQAAIDDALFCAVQFRAVQLSELYAIIADSHQAREVEHKRRLQRNLSLVCLLLGILAALFFYAYVQVHRLRRIRLELSEANASLARFNEELADKNGLLAEANSAKVQYIARFSDLCSMYIDKMDAYRKSLKKLLQDQKFDQLARQLKSTSMLENEQKEFYKTFDSIFLNLYPTFVDEFNALLAAEERIERRPGDLLNRELRIYALLRLGIADNQRIASFLRCSLSTVYNYRTRMRNRAACPRDEFEERVMQIGKINRKA